MEDRERERKMKLKFRSKRFLFNNGRIYKEKDDGYPFYSLTTILNTLQCLLCTKCYLHRTETT